MASETHLYEVVSHFLYRKEVTTGVHSVHTSRKDAENWAMYRCLQEHGEVYDVSSNPDAPYGQGPVYGKENPWQSNVYFVRELPATTVGPPPRSFMERVESGAYPKDVSYDSD